MTVCAPNLLRLLLGALCLPPLLFATAGAAHSPLLYETHFDRLEPEWRHHGNSSTRIRPAPDGRGKAAYFEINHGDLHQESAYRSEIVFVSGEVHPEVRNAELGKEYWYGFSIWLDEHEPDTRGEIWFQWGRAPDRDAAGNRIEIYGNPPLALGSSRNGEWTVTSRSDRRKITPDRDSWTTWNQFVLGKQETGRWTHFVFNVRWAYNQGQGGFLRVWQDGKLKVDHTGPNTYNDDVGPKITTGIYKFSWRRDQSTAVSRLSSYVGALRIADARGSFEAVSTLPQHMRDRNEAPARVTQAEEARPRHGEPRYIND